MAKFRGNNKPNKRTNFLDPARNDTLIENKDKNINFSFKYFKEDDDFHIRHEDVSYLQAVIDRLKNICSMSFLQLMSNRSKTLRAHRIDWKSDSVSRENFDIPGEEDLYEEAYQFSVSKNSHGRIMGFFTDDRTFNIVWFDKDHELYP